MGRILAIDFGLARTGLAVSDPMRIIATPLETVSTPALINYLERYDRAEGIDEFVIGMPRTLKNTDSQIAPKVREFIAMLQAKFPGKNIHQVDERFTSSMAQRALIEGGMKKKDRQVKGNVDKVSATIILQDFMKFNSR